jgi:hypothetical protein
MDEVVQLATETGEVVRHFSMTDVIAANPMIHILDIRQQNDALANANPRSTSEKWQRDPIHLNDVEPLPAGIADRFQDFKAGDLLLSARVLNLVFVLDPETLIVKWWQSGTWRRQHDPDWQPTGEISVYDNRTDRDYSQIVSMAPPFKSTRVVFDGRTHDWYSRIQGNHQITKAGNILITSPQQGRVLEVDPYGQLVFEMFNIKPGSTESSHFISDATWFPTEAFDLAKDLPCADQV